MRCPHCARDINDDQPECPACRFHIRDLDAVFGPPPPREGDVVDLAGVLSAAERDRLAARLKAFADATGWELVAVTAPTTAPRLPAEYVFWLHNHWRIGGPRHGGVLVLLALAERRLEVEVGYSLEGLLSDAAGSAILEAHAVPFCRAGRYGEGLLHACDVLARVLENAAPVEAAP